MRVQLPQHGRDTGVLTLATVPEGVPVSPRTLKTLKELEAQSSEAKATAFQHLLLLVGIHLFKVWRPGREGVTDLGSAVARRGSGVLKLAGFLG